MTFTNTTFSRYIASQLGVDDSINLTDAHYNTIKQLLNWIEDRRIDYKIYTIAPGYRMYYEAMYDKYFNDKIIDRALATEEKSEETWDDYMFHVINFTNPNRKLHTLSKLQQIWDLIDLKHINRLQNTYEALDVAIEVFQSMRSACKVTDLDAINDMFNENDLGKPNSDDSSNTENPQGSGSDGDSDDSDSDDSDSDANTESDESQSETSGQPNKSKMSASDQAKLEKAIRQQQDFIDGTQKKTGRLNKVQSKLVAAMRESGTETRVVKTGADGGTMGDITTVVIKKLSKDVICAMPGLFAGGAVDHINNVTNTSKFAAERINNMNNVVTTGIILGKQLGNKLQLRNADRTLKTTRLETGKIDRRLVAQLGYDNVNVFHRIVTDKFKNYFIHISIDASGSMSGDRIEQAIKSAVAIAQAASMTTGIRVQISLRGTDNMQGNTERCVTVYAYDSATDKISKIRNIFKYLNVFGCTPEGIAFKSIEKDLKADAKGDELIFINYSDGSPSNVAGVARSYNGVEYTRKIINDLRSMNMNIISYFISDGSSYDSEKTAFKRMYGVDAQFINPVNMTDVSKTMNTKFLEIAK